MFYIGYCKYTLCNTIAQLKLVSTTCICRRRCFQLQQFLMKPFPYRNQNDQQRIFSYYLLQARRVIENTFGIMVHRFALLRKSIILEPKKVEKIILAIVTLHNILRKQASDTYQPPVPIS